MSDVSQKSQAVRDSISHYGWHVDRVDEQGGWTLILCHHGSGTFLQVSYSDDVLRGPQSSQDWDRFRDEVLSMVRQYPNGVPLAKGKS